MAELIFVVLAEEKLASGVVSPTLAGLIMFRVKNALLGWASSRRTLTAEAD